MKILSLSTSDQGGGAEQVAWDLFTGLEKAGHESWLVVGQKHRSHPKVFEIHASPYFDYRPFADRAIQESWERVRKEYRNSGGEDFVYPYSHHLLELIPDPPDAVIAHNLHGGYFDLRALTDLSVRVPVVTVLHDYWMLTGHCAYPFDCERWRSGCGSCPDLTIPPAILRDATRENLQLKQSVYERSKMTVCSPSEQLLADVEASVLKTASTRVEYIPNGIDLQTFCRGYSKAARVRLNLPPDLPLILMLGKDIEKNRFKDYECAEKCIQWFASQNRKIGFVFLGASQVRSDYQNGSVTILTRPFAKQRSEVADYYRAADVLLHATRQEVAPLVISEALACGLPVVASAVGNTKELVGDGGFAVAAGEVHAHVNALQKLLDDSDYKREMAEKARTQAERTGGLDNMVSSYEVLLRDLILNFHADG